MNLVTPQIRQQLESASWIRRMFDAGLELKQRVGADNVFDFSLGNPDVPPPGAAVAAMKALAEQVATPMGLGYCPNAGLPSVRAALARKLSAEQQAPVEARHVLLTCGAAGGLVTFFRAVLEPGDEVLCFAPYFVEYGAYAGHFGGVLKAVPSRLPDFAPDLEALAAAVGPRTRAILICSPTTRPAPSTTRRRCAGWVTSSLASTPVASGRCTWSPTSPTGRWPTTARWSRRCCRSHPSRWWWARSRRAYRWRASGSATSWSARPCPASRCWWTRSP